MADKPVFPGVFIAAGRPSAEFMRSLDEATREWEMRAARGECAWICADCCGTFPEGMPDSCAHGHQSCTDIIQRDKRDAAAEAPNAEGKP